MENDDILGSEYDSDMGLDDEDRKAAQADSGPEWYKGVKGRTDRASIVYFHPVDVASVSKARKKNAGVSRDDLIKLAQKALSDRAASLNKAVDQLTKVEKLDLSEVHFKKIVSIFGGEGIGSVISRYGKDGAAADEVWKRLGEPKTHYTTVLVIYPTNASGELDKNQIKSWAANPILKPWKFSPKRYEAIWKCNRGLQKNGASIADQDLLLDCKEAQYQQIEITGDGKGTYLRSEGLKRLILEKAVALYDKLVPCREMTTDQLREKLGLSSGSSSGSVSDVSSDEFNNLVENMV